MPDLSDGQSVQQRGSSGSLYDLKNVGGTYSCSCPAWRNQSRPIAYRTCNHLLDFRGPVLEAERIQPGGRDGMPSTVLRRVERYWSSLSTPNTVHTVATFLSEPVHRATRSARRNPTSFSAVTDDSLDGGEVVYLKSNGNLGKAVLASGSVNSEPAPQTTWSRLMDSDPFDREEKTMPVSEAKETKKEGFAVLLAHSWDGVENPSGWLMSEKLDGVRAYWDGKDFISRLGNVFAVPDWYKEGMPSCHLDGEFWLGRGRFQETSGYVRRQDKGNYWRQIKYMVFDAPNISGGFEERIRTLRRSILLPDHVGKVCHWPCIDTKDLKAFLAEIEAGGGEGVMLRRADSIYERIRSQTLLKVKNFHDSEAIVKGYTKGKGRHNGRVGALMCEAKPAKVGKWELRPGIEFSVGTGLSDADRTNPPQIGSTITFRFQELTQDGIPRFPSYVGQRNYE